MTRKRNVQTAVETEQTGPALPETTLKRGRKGVALDPEDFWRLVKDYRRGPGTEFQLYRRFPVIDRRLSGETKKSIAIEPEMDRKWIKANFGTGTYTVYFLDHAARPSCIANCIERFDIDWSNPPILDQKELVEGPDNKGYIEQLKVRGMWKREEQTEMAEQGAATAAVQEIAGIAKGVIEQAQKPKPADLAEKSAIEIMSTAYKAAAGTIAETRPPAPDRAAADSPLVLELLKQNNALVLELARARNNPAPAASLDAQLGVVTKVLEFAGRVNAPAPASWLERLPDLLPVLGPVLARALAPAAPPFPYAPGAPLPPMAENPAPGYSAFPASVPPGYPASVGPAAPLDAERAEMAEMEARAGAMGLDATKLKYIGIAKRAVRAYQEQYSGEAFAEQVERVDGDETYRELYAAGKSGVLLTILREWVPVFLPAAGPVLASAEFEAWIAGFVHYGDAGEAGGLEEDAAAGEDAA